MARKVSYFCTECGNHYRKTQLTEVDNKPLCKKCLEEMTSNCSECGEKHLNDTMTLIDNKYYCDTCKDELYVECSECGELVDKHHAETHRGDHYCQDCFNDKFTLCEHCDERVEVDDAEYINGYYFCDSCVNNENVIVTCDRCGEYVLADNSHGDNNISVCDDCYNNYERCSECDALIPSEAVYWSDGLPVCRNCQSDSGIHDYNYKPISKFYGGTNENALFMGVELEVDKGDEINDCVSSVVRIANEHREHIYCKHDGSLDEGFEIVSHPMTLDYHIKSMPWNRIMKECISYDFKSHDAQTCGLHVHLNKKSFGATEDDRDISIMKLLFFIERFWNQVVKFSRRSKNRLSYSKRYGLKEYGTDSAKELFNRAKDEDRYFAVNLNNSHTVEIRIFRGTLNYQTFIASLQLCQELVRIMKVIPLEELQNMHWNDFVAKLDTQYKELHAYLKIRKLLSVDDKPIIASYEEAQKESYRDDDDVDDDNDDNNDVEDFNFDISTTFIATP